MTEVQRLRADDAGEAASAGRLLHDFNTEYDDPTPGPEALAARLAGLVADGGTEVLLAHDAGAAVGVAVCRLRSSLWSTAEECHLAELYVVPDRRGQGHGAALMAAVVDLALERGCDFLDVVTSEDDVAAWHLYERFAMIRTEGPGGPLSRYYERELPPGGGSPEVT